MKQESKIFEKEILLDSLLNNGTFAPISFIQDIEHIGTKKRNRLLKVSNILPMGNRQVSVTHLKSLIYDVPKIEHELIMKDICPDDRQNFKSLEKIMKEEVSLLLSKAVPGSEATIQYLKLCRLITSSFLNNLPPLARINRLCYSVYFLRIWRKWVVEHKKEKDSRSDIPKSLFSLSNNFITQNAYVSIELNALFLLNVVITLRNEKRNELFLPVLYSSQCCEKVFRQMRSMTTMNWTKINFTLLKLFHLIGRVELQSDIMYELRYSEFVFPRIQNKKEKMTVFELPTNEQVKNTLKIAKQNAISDANKFEMYVNENDSLNCQYFSRNIEADNDEFSSDENDSSMFEDEEGFDNFENFGNRCYEINKDFDSNLDILDAKGNWKKVKKSSYLRILLTSKDKPSSDRLKRVQHANKTSCRRRLEFADIDVNINSAIFQAEEICIGQWCVFKIKEKYDIVNNNLSENLLIGFTLGFRYHDGTKYSENVYKILRDFKKLFY